MSLLPSIHNASATLCPSSLSTTREIPHDLTLDQGYTEILRSHSSKQDLASITQISSPKRPVRKRHHSLGGWGAQSSLADILTKQIAAINQALQKKHLPLTQKLGLYETKETYRALLNAPNIEQEIQKWGQALPATKRQILRPQIWETYKNTLRNVEAFSAFLQKVRHAFYFDFSLPGFSLKQGFYNRQKATFAQERLLPVLHAIQKNASIAEKLFCMADDGLGACHDRPSLTLIDMELETQCFLVLEKLENATEHSTESPYLYQKLIQLEAQKYRKQLTVSMLAEAFRTATHGDTDPLQAVLVNYGKIANTTRYFPKLPYRMGTSSVPQTEQDQCRQRVLNQLLSIDQEDWQTRLETHLQSSDHWFTAMRLQFPETQKQMQSLEKNRLAASEQLIDDSLNTSLDQAYALKLEAINLAYEKQKAELFNNPARQAFTRKEVSDYLLYQPIR